MPILPVTPFSQIFPSVSKLRLPQDLQYLAKADSVGLPGIDYDHYVVETMPGPRVICFMRLYFLFRSHPDGGDWTSEETQAFLSKWRGAVTKAWNTPALTRTPSGRIVSLGFHFDLSLFNQAGAHWVVYVDKIKKTSFGRSFVCHVKSEKCPQRFVQLTSNDYKVIDRNGFKQQVVRHEFGHMINQRDEYEETSTFFQDKESMMNIGDVIKPRHLERLRQWANLVTPMLPKEQKKPAPVPVS